MTSGPSLVGKKRADELQASPAIFPSPALDRLTRAHPAIYTDVRRERVAAVAANFDPLR